MTALATTALLPSDVDQEEGPAAADEDGQDQDWCDENPSNAHGGGQSTLSFAGSALMPARFSRG